MHSAPIPLPLKLLPALLLLAALPALADAPSAESLESVTVTGSRIARSAKEGPTSVTIITGADIEKQGYTNVYDALNNLTQNTGFTQGADFGNTFTPAANAISLRGLGPNHTLTLINGRRMADYPIAYEGQVNFVNLANIPSALIDRIEILNGGASAIYGSDAIAGVVNIILKKKTDGTSINVKIGGAEHHGGENARLQLTGGKSWDQLSVIYGLEISQRNPIWSRQRGFMSDSTAQGEAPSPILARRIAGGGYLDAGSACGNFSGMFAGSVSTVGNSQKGYCASGLLKPSYWTIQTANQSQSGFLSLSYLANPHVELFSDAMIGLNHTENNTRGPNWTAAAGQGGYFRNQNTGNYEIWNKRFAPEELGGTSNYNRKWDDLAANLTLGARGELTGSWNYEAAYNASLYTSRATTPMLLSGVNAYFLGPQLGADGSGIPIYAPNLARFYQPLTPAQASGLIGDSNSHNKSWLQVLSLSASGEAFQLPAGPAKLAGLLEWGSQGFSNDPDQRLNQGVFYNANPAIGASGSRSREAAGAELLLPLAKPLNLTLSGRYDRYQITGNDEGKFTYGAGLEYRPIGSLLLRGNYATSFRAPDMSYLFQTQTRGYYSSTTDYWRCAQSGQPLASCQYAGVSPGSNYVSNGNPGLKPESGKSYGFGFVWSPSRDADLSLDYWNITIDDLVTTLSADKLLQDEARCRAGGYDGGSALCRDALSRIVRNPANALVDPGAINTIIVNPINAASERTSGIDLSGKYRLRTARLGDFLFKAAYTKVLTHTYQQFASDPAQNELTDMSNTDWPDKLDFTTTWNIGDWSSTLLLTRYGKIPNGAGTGYLTPTVLANLSVTYQASKKTSIGVIVNNLQDFIKKDYTGGWPYYPVGSYTPYGRQAWLELNHKF
ncbi:TonB-dependent receptor [Chromobacterium violaceum]|uniref:TonB-dependent receptor plug domain-containing protein n=1 Tax=Chromobacterium violaceum TaxID=536 RepID=UPI000C12887B|nr:TonB-dependent receptor [Chromobacterium violaceum]ATP27770.1 TonB-dependent receptor [Chromobacterium violaceum]ATP31682.1 TonB-dependent receptor [Chromobacterium violaceum]